MAEYTSSQAGNWSLQATWGGSGPPANGDTAIIAHAVTVNANTTVGASGAADSVAVTIQSGKTLTVAADIAFTVRGDLVEQGGTLTLSEGSSYIFDSSAASGTPIYKITMGSAGSQQNQINFNGAVANRCTVGKAVGSGVGAIASYHDSADSAWGSITATYTDFSDLGTSSVGNKTDAIYIRPRGSGDAGSFDHCTFTRCSRIYIRPAATTDVVFTNNSQSEEVGSWGLWISADAGTTGVRTVTDNALCTNSADWTGVIFQYAVAGTTFARNIVSRVLYSGVAGDGMTACEDIVIYTRNATNPNSNLGDVGETVSRIYRLTDNTSAEAGYITPAVVTGATGTMTFDGLIAENTASASGADIWKAPPATSAVTYSLNHVLSLPAADGEGCGNITAHGSAYVSLELDHCTLHVSGEDPTAQGGVLMGSGYFGHENFIKKLQNTLFWANVKEGLAHYGTAVNHYYNPLTGTAESGNTTSLTDNQAAFTSFTGLVGATLTITGQAGSGPAVGETSIITVVNSATQVTFSPALSEAVDSDTQYAIGRPDAIRVSDVLNNAMYNVNEGTNFDEVGGNSTASYYDSFWLTDQTIGSADIDLGTGTDAATEGPKFQDKNRCFATADIGVLGNSAGTTWSSGTTYVVGDICSAATSTFYGNQTINFRCIANHSNKKPGSASDWRTYWELATVYRLKQDTSKIRTVYDWVFAGFSVQSDLIGAAGTDGAAIGAGLYVKTLEIADSLHTHASDNVDLTGTVVVDLVIQDSLHTHASDVPTLTPITPTITIPISTTTRYDVGDLVRVTGYWSDPLNSDTLIDPTVVSCSVRDPSGTVTTYVYGTDSEVVKDSTGTYYLDISVDESGVWYYRWFSSGTGQAAAEKKIVVRTLMTV